MNKYKVWKKAATAGLSVLLGVTMAVPAIPVVAEEKKNADKMEIKEKAASKEETVYVNADASGAVDHITVSDWLKNAGSIGALKDFSTLSDITNIKGEETYKTAGNQLIWNTDEKDIYYQGKTDKELPISMKITYKLDGKQTEPKDMVGKSGKMEMNIHFENHEKKSVIINGRKEEICVPFTMITGVILPTEHFKNVNVDHGKILSDADKDIVAGIAFPGLKKSLGLSKEIASNFDLPESIKITADVEDFEMGATFTAASSDLLSKLELGSFSENDSLKDSLQELKDSSKKLVSGTNDLDKGIQTLKNKSKEFTSGIDTLTNGLDSFESGAKELKNGVKTYTDGADKLSDGVIEYVKGAGTLADGVKSYTSGADQLADGVNQLAKAVGTLPNQLKDMANGIKSVKTGTDTLVDSTEKVKAGMTSVNAGIDTVHSTLTQVQTGMSGLTGSVSEAAKGIQTSLAADQELLKILEALPDDQKAASANAIAALKKNIATQKQVLTGLNEAANGSTLSKASEAIDALVKTTGTNGELKAGASAVESGLGQVIAGEKTLKNGVDQLNAGAGKLTDVKIDDSMPSAVAKLQAGAKSLKMNGTKLNKGADSIKASGKELQLGAKTLKAGSSKLNSGSNSLAAAAIKLETGGNKLAGGTSQLSSGIDQLSTGSGDLKSGMKKFDKEGIQKLYDTIEDNLNKVMDRLEAMTDAGSDYNSFSGISDNMNGTVKFVIETAEIKREED